MNKTIKVILSFRDDADPNDVSELSEDFADLFAKVIGDEVAMTDARLESWWVEVEAD